MAFAIAGATLSLGSILANPTKAEEYKFTIENKTDVAISQVLVSEDGERWVFFRIESNIAPHGDGEIIWGENSNHTACSQWIKVGFEDGTMSDVEKFDFCANPALVIE
ncbi:hypothetical protein [Microcoleus vaginatus]|uniref:hypothetical protein n=1 Tax=Microcoleus vaginatus TaxID=119532 RepID=UPI001F60BD8D